MTDHRRPLGTSITRDTVERFSTGPREQMRAARVVFTVQHAKIVMSERRWSAFGRGTGISSPARVYTDSFAPANSHTSPSGEAAMMDILLTGEAKTRFEAKYSKSESGCWVWLGKASAKGYGRFCYADQVFWAHRAAYQMHHGFIDPTMEIDHTCRNRMCVNPAHLDLVTPDENRRRGHEYIGRSNEAWGTTCKCGDLYAFRRSGKDKKTGEVRMMRYCPTCTREVRRRRWIEKRA